MTDGGFEDEPSASSTGDDESADLFPAAGHPPRRKKRLQAPKGAQTRTLSDEEMLERVEKRIQTMYRDGRVTVEDGREIFAPGAREELERLCEQASVVQGKLGPTQILAGFAHEIWLERSVYSIVPFSAWRSDYERTIDPAPREFNGPFAKRDLLIWLLWHFRQRTLVGVARAPHKVRGPLVECAGCGYRHRYLGRPRDEMGVSSCRRCGNRSYRNVQARLPFRPFEKVTKAGLYRRFKLTRRALERILATKSPT